MTAQAQSFFSGFILFILITLSGCGTADYERGLNETAMYLDHVNKININLTKDEMNKSGFSIRVPVQYSEVRSNSDKEENEKEAEIDPTQPFYIDVKLPGLVQTWKANLDVDDVDAKIPSYIYLVSSESLGEGASTDPESFTSEVTQRLVDGLGVEFPEDWNTQEIPPKKSYSDKKKFTSTTLYPEKLVKLSDNTPAVSLQADIFLYEKGNSKAAIIFVYPQHTSGNERLGERIELCLETFEMKGGSDSGSSGSSSGSGGGRRGKKSPSVGF